MSFNHKTCAMFAGALFFASAFFMSPCLQSPAFSAEKAMTMQTIESQEVKDEAAVKGPEKVSLADVEQARQLTADRIYGLAGLWLLIALGIFLLRCQVRDDERLYDEGYYNKKIE